MIDVPLPADVPPHETVYHFQIAPVPNEPPVSVSVTEDPGHTVADGFAVNDVGAVEIVFVVIVCLFTAIIYLVPASAGKRLCNSLTSPFVSLISASVRILLLIMSVS